VAIPAPSFENAASFEETESYEVPEGHAAFPGIDPGANLMAETNADTGVDIVEPDIPDAEPWAPAPFETEEELAPVILPEPEVETPPPALLPTAEVQLRPSQRNLTRRPRSTCRFRRRRPARCHRCLWSRPRRGTSQNRMPRPRPQRPRRERIWQLSMRS
jgi:hypothetical protein